MFAGFQYIVLAKYVCNAQLFVWQHVTVDGVPKKVPDPFVPILAKGSRSPNALALATT